MTLQPVKVGKEFTMIKPAQAREMAEAHKCKRSEDESRREQAHKERTALCAETLVTKYGKHYLDMMLREIENAACRGGVSISIDFIRDPGYRSQNIDLWYAQEVTYAEKAARVLFREHIVGQLQSLGWNARCVEKFKHHPSVHIPESDWSSAEHREAYIESWTEVEVCW